VYGSCTDLVVVVGALLQRMKAAVEAAAVSGQCLLAFFLAVFIPRSALPRSSE
jgi:hypothetical protein